MSMPFFIFHFVKFNVRAERIPHQTHSRNGRPDENGGTDTREIARSGTITLSEPS